MFKKYGRPIFYVLLLIGVAWYLNRFMNSKAARENSLKAVEHINAGEYSQALPLLEVAEVKASNGGDAETIEFVKRHLAITLSGLGQKLMEEKKHEEAIPLLKRVHGYSREIGKVNSVYRHLGECFRSLPKPKTKTAIEYMELALKETPGDTMAAMLLKQYQNRLKELAEGKKAKDAPENTPAEKPADK